MSKFRHLASSCIGIAPCSSQVFLMQDDLAVYKCMEERQAKVNKSKKSQTQSHWVNQI